MSDEQIQRKLKRLIRMLESIKGRHTELVTVYIPVGYSISEIINQLRSEQSTSENIKSKPVRKNVTSALDKIMRHLQLYKKTPEHGLAIFCGNVAEKEGVADLQIWAIEPPEPVKVKMYWCDQKFVLEPLKDMIKEKEIYGIISVDKGEADIAILKGKKILPVIHMDSIVPGKTRAGGQSSMRFARVREGMLNDWLKHVGETANKIFEQEKDVIGIIVGGAGPIKEFFLRDKYLHADVQKKLLGTIDTGYSGEFGLHEIVEKSEDILREASIIKEKKLLQRFLEELQKPHGLVAYGIKEVISALEAGAVDTVVLSEALHCYKQADDSIRLNTEENLGQEIDATEYFEEKVKNYNTNLELVSKDTREGEQFLALGGIGAFLRYRI